MKSIRDLDKINFYASDNTDTRSTSVPGRDGRERPYYSQPPSPQRSATKLIAPLWLVMQLPTQPNIPAVLQRSKVRVYKDMWNKGLISWLDFQNAKS